MKKEFRYVINTENFEVWSDVRAGPHTTSHLKGHLIFGDVVQDDEALFLSFSGAETEFLSWTEAEKRFD